MVFEKRLQALNIRYLKDKMLKNYTTFKIGGIADYLIFPNTIDELIELIRVLKDENISWILLGNFSNVLISDRGFSGAIVSTVNIDRFLIDGSKIVAECGCMLTNLAKKICENNLTGFEFAVGIPGTVGGAVYMNAGAYDGEIKDVLERVDVLDDDFNVLTLPRQELNLSYRHSRFQDENLILLRAYFTAFDAKDKDVFPVDRANDILNQRRQKQPLQFPSAGSIFKRPKGYFAGQLIEKAGLKGYRVGDACISDLHAGFIINLGNARAEDVRKLIYIAQKRVFEVFGVMLEPEIKFIGEFDTPLFST